MLGRRQTYEGRTLGRRLDDGDVEAKARSEVHITHRLRCSVCMPSTQASIQTARRHRLSIALITLKILNSSSVWRQSSLPVVLPHSKMLPSIQAFNDVISASSLSDLRCVKIMAFKATPNDARYQPSLAR